jgi:hypothetical protein
MTDTGASSGYSGAGEASVFVDGSTGKVWWYNPIKKSLEELSSVTPRR